MTAESLLAFLSNVGENEHLRKDARTLRTREAVAKLAALEFEKCFFCYTLAQLQKKKTSPGQRLYLKSRQVKTLCWLDVEGFHKTQLELRVFFYCFNVVLKRGTLAVQPRCAV